MMCSRVERGVIVSGATVLLIIISIGIIGAIALINIVGAPRLTIQLSEQSLRVPGSGGVGGVVSYSSLDRYAGQKDYVVVMQVIGYTPAGYAINMSAILSRGFQTYRNSIDLSGFIKVWEHYYRSHPPFTFYRARRDLPIPSITVFLITYLPDGRVLVGSDGIDSYTALLMMGYTPWKAEKILLKDPLYPFRHPIFWVLNMTLTPVDIDKIVENITRSVEKITGQRLGVPGILHPTNYQGVETRVWLKQLYDARNNPPRTWYENIVDIHGDPAPSNIVDNAWYAFATRFSQEYIFDKNTWSFQDAVRFALLGQNYREYQGKPTVLMTMTSLLHILYSGTSGYRWRAVPVDETMTVPLLYIAADYHVSKQQRLYITMDGEVMKTNFTVIKTGLALFGYMFGTTKYSTSLNRCSIHVFYDYPSQAIMAPLHMSNIQPGMPDDLVVLIADVTSNSNSWIVKPLIIILPYMTSISIDYSRMKPVNCLDGAPPNYEKVVWESYLDDVFDQLVTKSSAPGHQFYHLVFASGKATLTAYSGSIIGYYFPLIGQTLENMGFIGEAAETLGGLIGIAAASTDPLAAVAVFMAELIGHVASIALYQAHGSLVAIAVDFNNNIEDNSSIPVDIKVRHGYAAENPVYKPLMVEVDVTIGYPTNTPPGAEGF